jgi:hypothetical protein
MSVGNFKPLVLVGIPTAADTTEQHQQKSRSSVNWFTLDLWSSAQALTVLGVVLLSGVKR